MNRRLLNAHVTRKVGKCRCGRSEEDRHALTDSYMQHTRVAMNNPEHKRFQFLQRSEFLKYWEQRHTMRSRSSRLFLSLSPGSTHQYTVKHVVLWSQTRNVTQCNACGGSAWPCVYADTCWGFSHSHTEALPFVHPSSSITPSLMQTQTCMHAAAANASAVAGGIFFCPFLIEVHVKFCSQPDSSSTALGCRDWERGNVKYLKRSMQADGEKGGRAWWTDGGLEMKHLETDAKALV